MRKTLAVVAIAGAAVLGISVAAPAVATTSPYSEPATSTKNKPTYWGADCKKIEFKDGVKKYTLPTKFYSFVVVKAGTTNTVYRNFTGGTVSSLSGKSISHIIYCVGTPTSEPTEIPVYDS